MSCIIIHTLVRDTILSKKKIKETVVKIIRRERISGDVSIHAIGERRMAALNRLYRGRSNPTDVLSFPAREGEAAFRQTELGDIFLCPGYIRRQAKRFGVSGEEECLRSLIHGMLHLLGYDHQRRAESAEMFRRQEKYLKICL